MDSYDEYIYINNAWEKIGNTQVDLSNYALKTDTILNTTLSMGRKPNTTVGSNSTALGYYVEASGYASFAEGYSTKASSDETHAEGYMTHATGVMAHTEGNMTTASGPMSHAEGSQSVASGQMSHAEGNSTIANASFSHAGGLFNEAMTLYPNWTANTAYEVGDRVNNSGSGYECVTANSDATWTAVKWKALPSNSDVYYAIGNGNSTARSNAMELKWNGDMALQGDMTLFKGTANEFNISSLKDAGGVEIFDFNLNPQSVVTTTATVADIIAAIDSGKSALGHMTMAVSGANLDGYTPLTATKMGSIMMLVLGKFDMSEVEIWLSGQSRGGADTWGINFVQTLKATGDDNGALPQAYSANSMPIKDLSTPVDNNDAATKKYVDDQVSGMVTDVQVNGTSVITDGVANVPVAGANRLGAAMVKNPDMYGIGLDSDGNIRTSPPSVANYKAGIATYKPVCVANQHAAAFYGLAKAAGDITQNQSSNDIGTYTHEAQAAIQNMLGIPQTGLSVVNGQLCITYEEVSA